MTFYYHQAFSRNIGIVSDSEQARLQQSTVAIAGLGGVGGDYLISLARAGVGGFHLAELDYFELANFNRQYGANTQTLTKPKIQVMVEYALAINPELRITAFEDGLHNGNLDAFLSGVDLVIDAMDVFATDMHPLLINAATEKKLFSLAAVPLGLGAGILAFGPNSMSYKDYFAITPGMSEEEKVIQFGLGFAPELHHLKYLDPASIDIRAHKGPSSIAGCKLCAALVCNHALTALLQPRRLKLAPWYTYFDMRLQRFHHRRLRFGNRGPIQQLKRHIAKKRLNQA